MKKNICNFFFLALLASFLLTACNEQKQELVAPKVQATFPTLKSTSTSLIDNPLFIAYMTTTTDFAQKTANIVASMSETDGTAYLVQLESIALAYTSNPSASNLENLATLLGFQDSVEYTGRLADMRDANRDLRSNYVGFQGLTNSEIDEIIKITAEEYQLRWGWWDRVRFRWCANSAARDFADGDIDAGQYAHALQGCREKYITHLQ